MYKALLIDYDYQIVHSASGQIARVFWEQPHEFLSRPIVVCSKQLSGLVSENQLIKVKDRGWIRHVLGLCREIGLPDVCHIPDQRRFSWEPFVVNAVKKGGYRFDYIHSISCPESSHLTALKIKQLTGKPWVAQFNDPWIGNEAKRFTTKSFPKIDARQERAVAENADLIIHSNRIMTEDWLDRYGALVRDKMVIFPFSFNIAQLPNVVEHKGRGERLKISHIGHMYGARSASPILKALYYLKNYTPDVYHQIELSFIGSLPDDDKAYIEENGLSDCVRFLGKMPPESLTKFYLESDVFLVIDMNVPRSPSYPSKLLMYHYYRRPILSIAPSDSIIEDDMLKSGHHCFTYDDVTGIANYLNRAVEDYSSLESFDHNYWHQFTVENVANLYHQELKKLFAK